jgi:hypothetical protein
LPRLLATDCGDDIDVKRTGKAREVPAAIQKAMDKARKAMKSVPLKDGTLYYPITSNVGAAKVYTNAEKPKIRPPLTTFTTRRILTNFSMKPSSSSLLFFLKSAIFYAYFYK